MAKENYSNFPSTNLNEAFYDPDYLERSDGDRKVDSIVGALCLATDMLYYLTVLAYTQRTIHLSVGGFAGR